MGIIFDRITGMETHKLSLNAVYAQHLIAASSPQVILEMLRAAVREAANSSLLPRPERSSPSKVLAAISKFPRAVQMNFIAYGCLQDGIRPRINGCDFYFVGNPFWARKVTPEHIKASVTTVRRFGQVAVWPGDSPLDLSELYLSCMKAITPDTPPSVAPPVTQSLPPRAEVKQASESLNRITITERGRQSGTNRFSVAEGSVSNIFVKLMIQTKGEFFRLRNVPNTSEKHLRALVALQFVTFATLIQFDAEPQDVPAFAEILPVIETLAADLETSLLDLANNSKELLAILEAAPHGWSSRVAERISGKDAIALLKGAARGYALPAMKMMAIEFNELDPPVAVGMAALLFVEEFVLGVRGERLCQESLEILVKHVATTVCLAAIPASSRKVA